METAIQSTYEPLIGVDIGPDQIRVVELERIGPDYHLKNVGITATPEGGMEDGYITDPRAVGRALKRLFQERRFSHGNVIAAVRGAKVATRLISLPAMPQDRLRRIIESEIDRYVMFGDQDKIVYYHPLEEFEEDGRRKVSVMLVIAERELCNSYYRALDEAGLDCVALDMSSYAILRVFRNSRPAMPASGGVMTVVYDFQGISMNIFHGDVIRYSRFVRMPDMDLRQMQNGFLDKFLAEIMLATQFYQSEYARGERIRKMVLCLGAAGGMELFGMLSDHIEDIPIEMHSPFANIRINPDDFPSDLVDRIDLGFLTAVGLAMRGIEAERLPFQVDLLPAEIYESKLLARGILTLGIVWLLIFIGFGFFFVRTRAQLTKVQQEKTRLEQKLTVRNTEFESLKQQQNSINSLVREAGYLKQTLAGHSLMTDLQMSVPKNVQLVHLKLAQTDPPAGQIPGKQVSALEITGITRDAGAVNDFVLALQNAPFGSFADMAPPVSQPYTVRDLEHELFTLSAQWTGKKHGRD